MIMHKAAIKKSPSPRTALPKGGPMSQNQMSQKSVFKLILLTYCVCVFLPCAVFADDRAIRRKKAEMLNTMKSEQRVALVIGNESYKSSPLRNPVNDAKTMSKTLKSLGFQVTKEENLGFQEMGEAIAMFGEKLLRGGVGLFYYAGHGIQHDGNNYLIPVGSDIQHEKQIRYRAVNAGAVLAEMENARNRLNIVILDACRNNPFARSFRSSAQGLASLDAPVGSIVAYATAPGKTASDGPGRKNGLYTSELIRQMRAPGVRLVDVFDSTRRAVRTQTGGKQVPWESRALEGAFYFRLPKSPGLLADGSAVIDKPAPKPVQATGGVQVKTTPAGATVWIGDKHMGKAPAELDGLKPGAVTVQAALEGYRDKAETVSIRKGRIIQVKLFLDKIDTWPKPKQVWRDSVTGMEFVWIPEGCYQMGSPSGEKGRDDDDEGPVHEVCVDGFWMGKYEVTNAQFRRFRSGHDSKDYKGNSLNGNDQPAVYVSWEDAKAFAKWLTDRGDHEFRLPTEAEWEYACRAGTKTARFWGDSPDDACAYANVADQAAKRKWSGWTIHDCDDGYAVASPVGSFRANGFGLYDMLGNIREWCKDIYASEAYGKHKRDNPIYASGGSLRVFRGGSWYSRPRYVRCANRDDNSPGNRNDYLGFRLVRTP